jgi:hypothetical protein
MVKRSCVVALVLLGLLGGCHQRQSSELDQRIPAANPKLYEHVRDAKEWRNPILVVYSDGIRLMSSAIDGGEKTVRLDQLKDSLKELPVSAWPYGRVVGWGENALRSGDDDQIIRRNTERMQEILAAMDVDAVSFDIA